MCEGELGEECPNLDPRGRFPYHDDARRAPDSDETAEISELKTNISMLR